MSVLIVNVNQTTTNNTLTIHLDGIVPEDVIREMDQALDKLRSTVLSLNRSIPKLRYADGFWTLSCSVSAKYRTTMITEAIALPLIKLGYRIPKEPIIHVGHQAESLTSADEIAAVVRALSTKGTSVTLARDEILQAYRPATELEGGDGQVLNFNIERSIEAKPATHFELGARRSIVIGLGWDCLHNRIYESIYGSGSPPDIDVVVYCVNRWGEVLYRLSPKSRRVLPISQRSTAVLRGAKTQLYDSAIKISSDSTSGDKQDDDELVIINLDELDPSICAVLVTASLAGGARDLRYTQNLYGRIIDVATEASELELCRLRIDTEHAPPDSKTAVIYRFDRGGLGNSPDASKIDDWTLEAVGQFCELANPALPYVKPGDQLVGIRCGQLSIPLCKTDFSYSSFFEMGVYRFVHSFLFLDLFFSFTVHCYKIIGLILIVSMTLLNIAVLLPSLLNHSLPQVVTMNMKLVLMILYLMMILIIIYNFDPSDCNGHHLPT
uniref:Uncharacterized protein n=1 Tax=Aureoumbra lagunensis TaxID=44058 RepID=A0A7S3NMI6_9STRA